MLRAEGLGFRYDPSQPWLFRDLSFALPPGRTLALLGPNGRGKTTLLKCLADLLRPSTGLVHRAGAIGYVPQQFVTPFAYSVRDVVVMGRARHLGMFSGPTGRDRRLADEALATLGMSAFADRLITTLSGGERQMVLMARALASGAQIMLLDEPTAALDFRNQAILLSTLRWIASERGMSIVMTSHDPAQALEVADQALLLYGSDRYEEGPAAAVLTEEKLSSLYGVTMRSAHLADGGGLTIVPDFRSVRRSGHDHAHDGLPGLQPFPSRSPVAVGATWPTLEVHNPRLREP